MKRTILLSAFVALAFAPAASAQTLTAAPLLARCGTTVSVPLTVDDVTGLLALELRLSYDASKLTATRVVAGDLTSGFQIASNLTPGLARIALASGKAVSGKGTVATITFNVAAGAEGDSPLSFSDVLVNDVSKNVADGVVRIACGKAREPEAPGAGSR